MVGVGAALEHERVDQPAVEAHPYPHPGLGVVGLLGGDQVVEFPVQMRHRQHRQHPGDRFVFGGLSLDAHPAGVAEPADSIDGRRRKNSPAVISTIAVA